MNWRIVPLYEFNQDDGTLIKVIPDIGEVHTFKKEVYITLTKD